MVVDQRQQGHCFEVEQDLELGLGLGEGDRLGDRVQHQVALLVEGELVVEVLVVGFRVEMRVLVHPDIAGELPEMLVA